MEPWLNQAKRTLVLPGCGPFTHGPFRVVVHSTEGDTIAGALETYKKTSDYPHFTIDANTIEQHCPLNVGSTALLHPNGTPDTNRASAIQIEMVGWAEKPNELPLVKLFELLHLIAEQVPVKLDGPLYKAVPGSLGLSNGIRMSDAEWASFNGVCGHQHVPNNDHGDPGLINLADLGSDPTGEAMARFPNAIGAVLIPGTTNQVWVVGSDGGVGAFPQGVAPFHGSMGGKPLNKPICALVTHGAGGYWLLGRDGGIFAFGDAPQIPPYQPLFGQEAAGQRDVVGGNWDGNSTLTLIGDDGDTYALHH